MEKPCYFKIQYGYGSDEYVTITHEELPKAIAVFVGFGDRAVFQNGAVKGKDIIRIIPDWHTHFGWNKTHKMDQYDWNMIPNSLQKQYQDVYGEAKKYTDYIIEKNIPELLRSPLSEIKQILNLPIGNQSQKFLSAEQFKV